MQLIDLFIGLLPTVVLLTLVVLIYFRGKGGNQRIVKQRMLELEETFSPFVEDFIQVNASSSSFTYAVQLKKPSTEEDPIKSIRRMRIHFSLEERHMLISWFILLFKKAKDFLIIEADSAPQKNDHLNLEIVRWADLGKYELQKFQEEWADLDDFEHKSEFSAKYFHKTNHPNALRHIYQKEPKLKALIYNMPGLFRISLKRKEDWGFRLAIRLQKEMNFRIAREITLRFMRGLSLTNQAIIKKPKRFLKN
ncbi:MAG: hypothetical protein ACXAC7_13070 [Candidatus Hodarchaeales archaeon]|jgi:hypothetical protein